ncbi:hypothetical protein FRB94_003216 [Tulasnella sp. JGI-2019a]|nr:hypothetical protein FRB94_003216 [Tulasnella sp. JGI-2019a]
MILSHKIILAITRRSTLTARRFLSSQPPTSRTLRSPLSSRKLTYAATVSLGLLAVTLSPSQEVVEVEEPKTLITGTRPKKESMSTLIRTYVVYSICSIPPLITYAPAALSFCQSIPGLKQIAEAMVRVTFFDQFVGADTAEETIPLLKSFREQNKGVMLVYSVEVDEKAAKARGSPSRKGSGPAQYRKNVEEIIHSIDVAGDFEDRHGRPGVAAGRKTWVALKLSALVPSADALKHLSSHLLDARPQDRLVHYPGTPQPTDLDVLSLTKPPVDSPLTVDDLDALRTLRNDLRRICLKAKQRDVKVVMDAEYTRYQAAIDAFQLSLMREFNTVEKKSRERQESHTQPLVYGTYQAYLCRNTMHLIRSLELAQKEKFILGVKLVRGAYHDQELGVASPYDPDLNLVKQRVTEEIPAPEDGVRLPEYKMGSTSPVWNEKWETDGAFNGAALMLVDQLKWKEPQIGVMFATHNKESCDITIRSLVANGLATAQPGTSQVRVDDRIVDRLSFGQLYGMSDALTDHLASTLISSSPIILKYLPYGSLAEVIPYLGRRAIENKSVLGAASGGAADERRRAGKEIWRRLTGET